MKKRVLKHVRKKKSIWRRRRNITRQSCLWRKDKNVAVGRQPRPSANKHFEKSDAF